VQVVVPPKLFLEDLRQMCACLWEFLRLLRFTSNVCLSLGVFTVILATLFESAISFIDIAIDIKKNNLSLYNDVTQRTGVIYQIDRKWQL